MAYDFLIRVAAVIAIIITASGVTARGQSLQEQAMCAAQAERAYRDWNNAGSIREIKSLTESYQSHYNTKLDKCLILIDWTYEYKGQLTTLEQLLDAFERHVFANYIVNSSAQICQLTPTLDKTTNCSHLARNLRRLSRNTWRNKPASMPK